MAKNLFLSKNRERPSMGLAVNNSRSNRMQPFIFTDGEIESAAADRRVDMRHCSF